MSVYRKFWNIRSLTLFLALNLIVLGIIVLVQYDSDTLLDWGRGNPHQSAYDRWRKIRSDWEKYSSKSSAAEIMKQKRIQGRQLDAVVGFDFLKSRIQKENESHTTDAKVVVNINYKATEPLNFIPQVPKFSETDYVPPLLDNITQRYLELPDLTYKHKIVILSPVCDVSEVLDRFLRLLNNLNYPHDLLSVYFGEDSSDDRTLDMATLIAHDLTSKFGFHAAAAFHFNISGGVHGSWGDKHDRASQQNRRAHLAEARNLLMKAGMEAGTFDYFLWIDSDITELPHDLIQQLLYANSDVAVPSCLYKSESHKRVFDKNSWRETPTSLEDQKHLPSDVLLVEGYSNTHRVYLSHLKAEGRVVPLDGVGGCSILIKSKCHLNGLNFPEKVYRHHIETEGLSKLAKDMGFSVVGLPFVEVIH